MPPRSTTSPARARPNLSRTQSVADATQPARRLALELCALAGTSIALSILLQWCVPKKWATDAIGICFSMAMTAYLVNRAHDETFSLRYMHKVAEADVRALVSVTCEKAQLLSKRLYEGAQWLGAELIECALSGLWIFAVFSGFGLLIWLLSHIGILFTVVLPACYNTARACNSWVSSTGVPFIVHNALNIVCGTLCAALTLSSQEKRATSQGSGHSFT